VKNTQIKSLCDWMNEIEEEIKEINLEMQSLKFSKDLNDIRIKHIHVGKILTLKYTKQRLQHVINLAQIN